MLKRFYQYMLSGYSCSSLEILKKARMLLSCVLLFCFINIPALGGLLAQAISQPSVFGVYVLDVIAAQFLYIIILILIKKNKYEAASIITLIVLTSVVFIAVFLAEFIHYYQLGFDALLFAFILVSGFLFLKKISHLYVVFGVCLIMIIILFIKNFKVMASVNDVNGFFQLFVTLLSFSLVGIPSIIHFKHTRELTETAKNESEGNKKAAVENKALAEHSDNINKALKVAAGKVMDIAADLNASTIEIESACREQLSGSSRQTSGITGASAALEELNITAKQITKSASELVFAGGEVIGALQDTEHRLLETLSQLDDVGVISTKNTSQIGQLSKRSVIIKEMVELIKEVANKTNILSINASIEASRSGEAGTGFAVVASEIRELSKETIQSAKNVEKTAIEIQDFLNSIVISSESESHKVIQSGKTVKTVFESIQAVISKINNNYSFTQKIDVSIKNQENGSKKAADTMRQMAETARQSEEIARQILLTVNEIVNLSGQLEGTVKKLQDHGEV